MASQQDYIYFYDFLMDGNTIQPEINEYAVMQSIQNLLSTAPGQRVYNPRYGLDLEPYLFTTIDSINANAMRNEIMTRLEQYEPRIQLINVLVDAVPDENTYFITIQYIIVGTQTQQSVTFNLIQLRQ